MTPPLVRLALAACLCAVPLAAQEVAPFALPSSTTGAEAVLLNPAALADLEGAHGYLGLQQLYQKTDWDGIPEVAQTTKTSGTVERSTQAPLAIGWNLGDDWAIGIGAMPAFDSETTFPLEAGYWLDGRKFSLVVREWRGVVAYRLADAVNLGLAVRYLKSRYAFAQDEFFQYGDPPDGGEPPVYRIAADYSGSKNALGLELSALWKAKGFALGMVLRPEVKFDYGYSDFGVGFTPLNVTEPEEAILRTYYPGGGVNTKAILPLEARVAVTLAPMGPWRFSGEVGWAQWSKWETISIDYANETVDPDTGCPVLSDERFNSHFKDAFTLTGMDVRTFDNAIEAYGRLAWQEKICSETGGATLRPNDDVMVTLGGRYPWKFGEFALGVDAFYTFGIYSSNNGFEMSRNLLGVGLSFAY